MTKISVISGLLVAGTVGVAAAPDKQETAPRVTYKDHGPAEVPADGWVELASPTPAKHGRVFVTVDAPYARLRLDAHAGRPFVHSIRVVFADGSERVVRVGHRLAGAHRSQVIDLRDARAIEHLVIRTDRDAGGTYTVHGAPPHAGARPTP